MKARPRTRTGLVLKAAILATALSMTGSQTATAAREPGPVSVYPVPGTPVASDQTTFSFRGLKPGRLGPVKVVGSKSGRVTGKRLAHSDGRGVSFVPDRRFRPGETVSVRTRRSIRQARNGDFRVRIGRFYGGSKPAAGPGSPLPGHGLTSRPDLRPPQLEVRRSNDRAAPGRIFFSPRFEGMTIADGQGRINWYQPIGDAAPDEEVWDLRAQRYLGQPVLTYWRGAPAAGDGPMIGRFEILDNSYRRIGRFTGANGYRPDIHEFKLSNRGTALVMAYRPVRWDLTAVGGERNDRVIDNVVQEVELSTGAVIFEWHALGSVPLSASSKPLPTGDSPWDFFHVNSASPDGDSILVSGRWTSSVYRIDRRTARVKWSLRGDRQPGPNSFRPGPGTSFGYQHDAQRMPNGNISLLDNSFGRDVPRVRNESSLLTLRLSRSKSGRRAILARRFEHPRRVISKSQANADRQKNGNFMVGWGSVQRLTEFTRRGRIAFDATFNSSRRGSYRAYRAEWEGFPDDRPAIASRARLAGATVWASWNGATTVDSWRVLTGDSQTDLFEVGRAIWDGLETRIEVTTVASKVQVVALDAGGKELGRSAVTDLGTQSR